jgi:nitrite reductase/ring-hydroxylating ferredoxin subunit
MSGEAMLPEDDVVRDATELVRLHDRPAGEVVEAVLVRSDGGVRCWLNACRHFTDVPLDRGDGAAMRDGEIVCTEHGAMFDAGSGRCTHGPCEGAVLPGIAVSVEDGDVVLEDDRYRFVGRGGVEDDGDDAPSSSRPREF